MDERIKEKAEPNEVICERILLSSSAGKVLDVVVAATAPELSMTNRHFWSTTRRASVIIILADISIDYYKAERSAAKARLPVPKPVATVVVWYNH